MSMSQEEYRSKLEEYKKNKEMKKLNITDKENKKSVINRGCPNHKKIVSEPLKKTIPLNAKASYMQPKKTNVVAANKMIKSIKTDVASRPSKAKNVVNEIAKSDLIASKEETNNVSFDTFTQAAGSGLQTYRVSSEISKESVRSDERILSYDHQSDDEPETISVQKEVMDIASMLESLQLQTPAKPQIKKEEPKFVNLKTAGDGVCISTDGPCLTVLTPVRASRKTEKELGVKNVITPVRRSIRNATMISGDESIKKKDQIHTLLNDHDFAYVPNDAF